VFRKDESSCKRQKRAKRILFEVEIKARTKLKTFVKIIILGDIVILPE